MKNRLKIYISVSIVLQFVFIGGVSSQTDSEKAFDGYTLFSTLRGSTTYLINMDGDIVHTWEGDYSAAFSTYFLENGHIFRSASRGGGMGGFGVGGVQRRGAFGGFGDDQRRSGPRAGQEGGNQRRGPGGVGAGGRIQEIDWDGELIWDFEYSTDTVVPHHDVARMPNGNVLLVCWDAKTSEEAIAAGRNPEYQTGELPPDCIIEIKQTGEKTGEVVWKWHVWDHLIQDFDPNKPNYGKVSEHPELIDINYSESWMDQTAGGTLGNRRGGGFGGRGGFGGGRIPTADWTHINAVAYNAELDQIILCSYTFSEFWIIDHSTTIEEAAGHTGGRHGRGGDLLYRWGNPAAYKRGTEDDQKLFCPHDAHWIDKGLPGEGHILIFNNGPNRQDGRYSTVDELVLPMDEKGSYKLEGNTFGPKESFWSYSDPNDKTNFFATNISGAQRLPNGNTLICEGPRGHLFEVTSDKEIVWDYRFSSPSGAIGGGMGAMGGFMGFGQNRGGFGMRGQGATPADANSAAPDIAAPPGQRGLDDPGMRGRGGNVDAAGTPGRGGARGGGMGTQIFRAYRIAEDHPGLKGKDLTPKKID